jgi:hypothetical protein
LIGTPGTATVIVVNPNGAVSNALTVTIMGFTTNLHVAQIADGLNWKTLFQVVNLDQQPVNFSMRFWDDNGNAVQLPFTSGLSGFSGTLAVGGTAFAETTGVATTLTEGWADASGNGRIGVLTIFRQIVPGRPDSEGTVAAGPSSDRLSIPFDNTNGYVTGLAVANTNLTRPLSISLSFTAENGSQTTGLLSLPPRGHTAFPLPTMFPWLLGVRGSIQFTASTPDISVVGLRFSPTLSFTSLAEFR